MSRFVPRPWHATIFRATAAGLCILGTLSPVAAGPLNPPAGPVASTGKTLTEVEPRIAISKANTPGDADSVYRITLPGSYYLTESVGGVSGRHGIEIAASDVTIDLMGYAVRGAAGSLTGIRSDGERDRIVIRNGAVHGWGGAGVDLLAGGTGYQSRFEHVVAANNVGLGLRGNVSCVFFACLARNNGTDGLVSQAEGQFSHCLARENGRDGFVTGTSGGQVSNCMARQNGRHGFNLGLASQVSHSTAQFNTGDGFMVFGASVLTACTARSNSTSGIRTTQTCVVVDCVASQNGEHGITVGEGSSVRACVAWQNTADGIRLSDDCSATQNTCDGNGVGTGSGAGIVATGIDNVIRLNNCTDNDRGIECLTFGNLIVQNFCSGNASNWNLAADNHYGPIVNITALPGAAVSGMGGATSTLATTDPWANFSH